MMPEEYETLQELIKVFNEDIIKFYEKNNKAAGTRASSALAKIRSNALAFRKKIIDRKKSF